MGGGGGIVSVVRRLQLDCAIYFSFLFTCKNTYCSSEARVQTSAAVIGVQAEQQGHAGGARSEGSRLEGEGEGEEERGDGRVIEVVGDR